jgi:hypothetical protein
MLKAIICSIQKSPTNIIVPPVYLICIVFNRQVPHRDHSIIYYILNVHVDIFLLVGVI